METFALLAENKDRCPDPGGLRTPPPTRKVQARTLAVHGGPREGERDKEGPRDAAGLRALYSGNPSLAGRIVEECQATDPPYTTLSSRGAWSGERPFPNRGAFLQPQPREDQELNFVQIMNHQTA
ncbi:hypothetical protein NDU88_005785 [Pleurodeles waltl]|uniref:Uncharacterized protein n=1 Tax=Pleurodeles waltl TaxID=8319 RepID=A0AAV7WYV2_PLEWA|nr:hypothetical protein NDU88_005785 [Pleurodeles waltl]